MIISMIDGSSGGGGGGSSPLSLAKVTCDTNSNASAVDVLFRLIS
jgi:hypothetical protein